MLAQQPEKNVPEPGASYRASETRVRPLRMIAREIRNADWRGIGILLLVTLAVTGAFMGVSALDDAPRKIERLILLAAAFWASIIAAAWASGRGTLLREFALVIAGVSFGATFWFLVALYQLGVTASEMHMLVGLGALGVAWSGKGKLAASIAVIWIAFSIIAAVHPIDWGAAMIERAMLLRGLILVGICFAAGWNFGGTPVLATAFFALGVLVSYSARPLLFTLFAPDYVVEVRSPVSPLWAEVLTSGMIGEVLIVPVTIVVWSLFAQFRTDSITYRLARAWTVAMLGKALADGIGLYWFIEPVAYAFVPPLFACVLTLLVSSARRIPASDTLFAIAASTAALAVLMLDEESARSLQVACGVMLTGWALVRGWHQVDWPLLTVAGAFIGVWMGQGIMYFEPVDYVKDSFYHVFIILILALTPMFAVALPVARKIAWSRNRRRHASLS